jgi:hypothetical protein
MDYKKGDIIKVIGEMHPRQGIPINSIAIVSRDVVHEYAVPGMTLNGLTWHFGQEYVKKLIPTRLEKLIYNIP